MPFRINVQYKIKDPRAEVKKKQFAALNLKGKLGEVFLLDSYTVDKELEKKQQAEAVRLLTNPLIQKGAAAPLSPKKFDFAIEISFLPGVTDNVAGTARETLEDGLKIKFKDGEGVYSSAVFFVCFDKNKRFAEIPIKIGTKEGSHLSDVKKIADSLYNPLIQKANIKSFGDFKKTGQGLNLPKVNLHQKTEVLQVNLDVADEELEKLGKLGIPYPVIARRSAADDEAISSKKEQIASTYAKASADRSDALAMTNRRGPLSLDLESLKTIRHYFKRLGRNPTDIELESLAQTWSEHCKHTIFANPLDEIKDGIYKHYIKRATEIIRQKKASEAKSASGAKDFCVSVFTDNAGGIIFDDNFIVTHKVETHNTPSALDPFGGAITGIVGVNRDCLGFGLGAKPIINMYGFCLADPRDESTLYRDPNKKYKMLSARRILDGVVAGVNAGGNQSGIPTNLGFTYFDSRYRGKPLVFAGTVGLIPKKVGGKPSVAKKARPGDYIVMLGGRVGQDGIHGATFSSVGLTASSPTSAVQIGDPITQKKFSDAIVREARDKKLYNSITDNGAGGLSCSVAEMAKESGGCRVQLEKVPLKYHGLQPWQIWISESQERMTLAVPKNKWKKFEQLMESRGVEATVIGQFTNSGKCQVTFHGEKVLDLEMDFLHNGLPKKEQTSVSFTQTFPEPVINKQDFSQDLLNLLSRPGMAGNEFISRQYDHEVQAGSVLKPLQGAGTVSAEATVTRPVLNSDKGVVLSSALFPSYSEINSYNMAAAAIDSAIRAAVATGANVDYLALLDNFCWCSSNDPYRLAQLKQAAKACFDFATAFGTPLISGKDSMFNDFNGFDEQGRPVKISIPPTLLISAIGVVPDVKKTVSLDAKMVGDVVYILGETHNELGGSEYFQSLGPIGNKTPMVDAVKNKKLYKDFYRAVQKNLVASAASIGRGGLATALAKTALGGNLGLEISLKNLPGSWTQNYEALFSESQGRILVTVDPKKSKTFEILMKNNAVAKLGKITNNNNFIIRGKNREEVVNVKLQELMKAYKKTFKDY